MKYYERFTDGVEIDVCEGAYIFPTDFIAHVGSILSGNSEGSTSTRYSDLVESSVSEDVGTAQVGGLRLLQRHNVREVPYFCLNAPMGCGKTERLKDVVNSP